MYANTLAFSYVVDPTSSATHRRTMMATLSFAAGALIGWSFALVVAAPFIFEELFMRGKDHVTPEAYAGWMAGRWVRLATAGASAALLAVPIVALDTLFYGRLTITPWNIIKYNIFPDSARGPNLYGTEPWYFYLLNLALNFNILLHLSLISLPGLLVTYMYDRKRLGPPGAPTQSSQYHIMALRVAPVYLWLGLLSLQAHKEERFMYPIYPLIIFNASVALYLIRGWMEAVFIKTTSSPYRVSYRCSYSLDVV
jgi:alpha-1,2-mannosyltransferase